MPKGAQPLVIVAAGGTGGHLFPAESLAVALAKRGVTVDLATDERATRYGSTFPARTTHLIPSATFAGRDPFSASRTLYKLGSGVVSAMRIYADLLPDAVVGFGGYPTIPPVLAAVLRRIPSIIHEQNGVLGRANRFLGPRVRTIATGFPRVLDHSRFRSKAVHTGNPVRPAVVTAAGTPYPDPAGPFRILVFGGSQGARVMADVVPAAVELVPLAVRARLTVTQQARDEDLARVRAAYARLGVTADVEPFFADLPNRMAQSHLVVSRSGASTVAELAAIGRPSILVPLPHALDQDQRSNAAMLEITGAAIMMEQAQFTPKRLAGELANLAAEPAKLSAMAASARSQGILDAADRLADLVLKVARIGAGEPAAAETPGKT